MAALPKKFLSNRVRNNHSRNTKALNLAGQGSLGTLEVDRTQTGNSFVRRQDDNNTRSTFLLCLERLLQGFVIIFLRVEVPSALIRAPWKLAQNHRDLPLGLQAGVVVIVQFRRCDPVTRED